MKITMIGTGYVGLVSGTIFAELGHHVTCLDVDQQKIDNLNNKGIIPIYEPGLEEMVKNNSKAGRLKFTTSYAEAIPDADAVFIAVGTPEGEDGSADLKYVLSAATDIARNLSDKYCVVVDKSTVPVGTGEKVAATIAAANPNAKFDVTSNPEFLREGHAIDDFIKPDRIVVGAETEAAKAVMQRIYEPLTNQGYPIQITNVKSAETIKYASNAFLAAKITFVNEMAMLCEKIGADIEEVSKGMGLDSRIGSKFLQAGPGWGGSCFPKDTIALTKIAEENGCRVEIVSQALKRNNDIKLAMVDKIEAACGNDLSGKTVSVLGLAFKANTDDMRDAPALTILPELIKRGAKIKAYDPESMEQAKRALPQDIEFCSSAQEALSAGDCAVALTEWDEFKNYSLVEMKELLSTPTLVDLRNLYRPEEAMELGFNYSRIGVTYNA